MSKRLMMASPSVFLRVDDLATFYPVMKNFGIKPGWGEMNGRGYIKPTRETPVRLIGGVEDRGEKSGYIPAVQFFLDDDNWAIYCIDALTMSAKMRAKLKGYALLIKNKKASEAVLAALSPTPSKKKRRKKKSKPLHTMTASELQSLIARRRQRLKKLADMEKRLLERQRVEIKTIAKLFDRLGKKLETEGKGV